MAIGIQLRRGLKQHLPQLMDGELVYCQDTHEMFIGSSLGNIRLNLAPSEVEGVIYNLETLKSDTSAAGVLANTRAAEALQATLDAETATQEAVTAKEEAITATVATIAATANANAAAGVAADAKAESASAKAKADLASLDAYNALVKAEEVESDFNQIIADGGSSNLEVVQARGDEATLDIRLDKLSRTPNEDEWTASEGQLVYTLNNGQTYDPEVKGLVVTVGGGILPSTLVEKTSSTKFTLLLDPSAIDAGMKISARWTEPYTPSVKGHKKIHELGGPDEIDVTKLKNYDVITQQLADTGEELGDLTKAVGVPVEYRGFGETNDDGCISRAIDKAKTMYPFGKLIFDARTYEITTPILHDTDGLYASMEGKGIRSTIIKAMSAMPYMVKLSQSSGNHARKSVKGIHFFGNGLADCGIDASYLRYATIAENEISGIAPNGYAIKCGNWVMRVKNNIINGLGMDGTTKSSNGILVTQTTINNLLLLENSITSCKTGLTVNSAPHDIIIEGNTFDSCEEAAIWFKLSGRHISVKRNYFENCGKIGVQVEKSAGVFETWYGAIVAHPIYTVMSELFEQFNIEDNEFANCSTDSYITLANISGLKVADNHCLGGYSSNQFINFRWTGVPYTGARRVEIDHANTGATFTQTVAFNTADVRLYQTGLIISGSKSFSRDETVKRGFEAKNLSAWSNTSAAWTITDETPFEGLFKAYKVIGLPNTNMKRLSITLDGTYSNLKGRYLRFNALSKGATGLPNGLWLQVKIDGVSALDVSSSTETWSNGSRSATILIPESATTLQIDLRPTVSDRDFYFTKFNICDASKEPEDVDFMTVDL